MCLASQPQTTEASEMNELHMIGHAQVASPMFCFILTAAEDLDRSYIHLTAQLHILVHIKHPG